MLRQLSSHELSELIAYTELHPLSPGQERMLAELTRMVAIGGHITFRDEAPEPGHFEINRLREG